ncbi:cysteine-rich KTR domain-containing protein [Ruthenibacterium lactatiformans]|uniref:cysteine-rich KTR domain-containing protein n=1 Tax=Ruthenibacterium lactatiformans TaxID=1550024 RepID=UPI000E730295|nr:cysteine-rich KTR domain-containing protein [Ruthenibacterium lactatiformans]RJW28174.1 conjugal transfer protein [Subdoligranulum sp. TF05-17AC]
MQGEKSEWILCPVCHSRTRIKVRKNTILLNFPLFCPKCKREILIDIVNSKICVIKE